MSDLIKPLAEPLAFFWALLLLWMVWLIYRRHWRHVVPPALLAGAIFLVGTTDLTARLLASLERPYAGRDLERLPPADAVVMLGGVLEVSRNDVFGFDLSEAADRFVMAAELVRRGKAGALVLGGGAHGPPAARQNEGDLLRRWLTQWNLAKVPVFVLGACATTYDEAQRTRQLAQEKGWQRVILVTSAGHMRRGEAVFKRLGIGVECVACDFQGLSTFENPGPPRLFPSWGPFEMLGLYLHEIIGWQVYRWRGWI